MREKISKEDEDFNSGFESNDSEEEKFNQEQFLKRKHDKESLKQSPINDRLMRRRSSSGSSDDEEEEEVITDMGLFGGKLDEFKKF